MGEKSEWGPAAKRCEGQDPAPAANSTLNDVLFRGAETRHTPFPIVGGDVNNWLSTNFKSIIAVKMFESRNRICDFQSSKIKTGKIRKPNPLFIKSRSYSFTLLYVHSYVLFGSLEMKKGKDET